MANTKEIKDRIKSVRDTQKITNAMYLIASTKMRKAKSELDHTRPYSGIPALLSRLHDAGICLAVCSNKADDFSRQLIEHYFPSRFSLVRGKLDGVPVKPDPAVVSAILEALHADPTTALFVGDSSVDIQTGHNAGLAACGVTWGFRSRQSLIDAGADFLSDTADALERLILGSL